MENSPLSPCGRDASSTRPRLVPRNLIRLHTGESRYPEADGPVDHTWMPACAGMTKMERFLGGARERGASQDGSDLDTPSPHPLPCKGGGAIPPVSPMVHGMREMLVGHSRAPSSANGSVAGLMAWEGLK